jgi:hypothetical protein
VRGRRLGKRGLGFDFSGFLGSVRHKFLILPNQTGTATSSPTDLQHPPQITISPTAITNTHALDEKRYVTEIDGTKLFRKRE